ncbi:hypothetical protein ACM66B_002203 [Microbotryomycetes sp. NB124-2]
MLDGFYHGPAAGAALNGLVTGFQSFSTGVPNDAHPLSSSFTSVSVSLPQPVVDVAASAVDLDAFAAVSVPSATVPPTSKMAFAPLFGHADSLPASPMLQESVTPSQFNHVSVASSSDEEFVAFPFDIKGGTLSSGSNGLGLVMSSKPLSEPAFGITSAVAHDTNNAAAMDRKLESPLGLEDSPFSDFLASPMFNDTDGDVPALVFSSLFPSSTSAASEHVSSAPLMSAPAISSEAMSRLLASVPPTPFVSPAFMTIESPLHVPASAPDMLSTAVSRANAKKSSPTGSRNSDSTVVPMDAPIQPRQYVLPSATSRKRKTVAVERALAKRGRSTKADSEAPPPVEPAQSQAQDDIPDDLVAAVERKRLQNTLSARKSRARKQERLAELEAENASLKARVEELEALLGTR